MLGQVSFRQVSTDPMEGLSGRHSQAGLHVMPESHNPPLAAMSLQDMQDKESGSYLKPILAAVVVAGAVLAGTYFAKGSLARSLEEGSGIILGKDSKLADTKGVLDKTKHVLIRIGELVEDGVGKVKGWFSKEAKADAAPAIDIKA